MRQGGYAEVSSWPPRWRFAYFADVGKVGRRRSGEMIPLVRHITHRLRSRWQLCCLTDAAYPLRVLFATRGVPTPSVPSGHLPLTGGVGPPTRNTNSKLRLLGLYSSLQSIRAAHEKVNWSAGPREAGLGHGSVA